MGISVEVKDRNFRQWCARLADGDVTVIIKRKSIQELIRVSDKAMDNFQLRLMSIYGE